MLTNSLKKIVLALGLAAVLFATGTAMANDSANARPVNNPYASYNQDEGSVLLDRLNRGF